MYTLDAYVKSSYKSSYKVYFSISVKDICKCTLYNKAIGSWWNYLHVLLGNDTQLHMYFMYLHVVSSGLGIPSRQYVKPPSPITFIPPRISSAPSTCTSLVGYVSDDEGMEMENYSDSHDNNANVHVSWFLLHTYIAYIFIGLGLLS